jgi:hypothetical protein
MFTNNLFAMAVVAGAFALSSTNHAAAIGDRAGRQVYDPPSWSFACMTDHGPRVWCDEPTRPYAN